MSETIGRRYSPKRHAMYNALQDFPGTLQCGGNVLLISEGTDPALCSEKSFDVRTRNELTLLATRRENPGPWSLSCSARSNGEGNPK
jgi:hypothetical protein